MANYVCTDLQTDWLGNKVCKAWTQLDAGSTGTSLVDALAITPVQAGELALSCCGILFLGWLLGMIGNMMLNIR